MSQHETEFDFENTLIDFDKTLIAFDEQGFLEFEPLFDDLKSLEDLERKTAETDRAITRLTDAMADSQGTTAQGTEAEANH